MVISRTRGLQKLLAEMSSQQPFNTVPPPPIGEVQHIHFLSEHIGALYLNDEYSDVTLIVENNRFYAHRVILAARSEYFRAMLFGGMKESQLNEIELKDTPLTAFKGLLRYVYMGHMTLGNQKDELILEILGLAHKYGFQDLEVSISDYLKANLSIKNVALVYDMASLYGLEPLLFSCCHFMDRHAVDVIQHESFSNLSGDCVRAIISRDSFCAPEVDIFKAVHNWVQINEATTEEFAQILGEVRLSLMPTQDLLKVVRPTNLVQPDVLLDAIQSRTECRDMELKYRGYLMSEENVATPKHGASVLVGEVKLALLDGDTTNYDMERGFSRHPIDDTQDKGIVVRLGMQCIINHFRMLLWDRDARSYSYYVDVSMDQKDWVRVVDHSKYLCRSWQELYFPPKVVRYIRIVGTHNTVNKVFHVVALEAYYTKKQFLLDPRGILIPKENVATIAKSACVLEGVCRSRNALLNGETSNYDWDSGYTCHQLGSGALVVQLGQPYAIDTMKLLLWDCDDRSYSYYIEVSNNYKDWEVIWDRSKQACQSWQRISFPRRPMVYIRIVGTHNTANEVFHCVHFECPAISHVPKIPDKAVKATEAAKAIEAVASAATEHLSEAAAAAAEESEDQEVETVETVREYEGAASVTVKNEDEAGMKNNFEDAYSHVSQHSSPTSFAGSVSGVGPQGMPMGASACSMARANTTAEGSNNPNQFPSVSSQSSSPVPFEVAIAKEVAERQRNNPQRLGGSAQSLTGAAGIAQGLGNLPAQVEEASMSLANLLEIEEQVSQNSTTSAASRRVQEQAPLNGQGQQQPQQPQQPLQGLNPSGGAIPRRRGRNQQNQQNNPAEEN